MRVCPIMPASCADSVRSARKPVRKLTLAVVLCSQLAAVALGQVTPKAEPRRPVDECIAALKSKDAAQRAAAAEALAGRSDDHDKIISALLESLHDDNDPVVKAAADALASYATAGMDRIKGLLTDPNPQVRRGVARALGLMGEKAGPAVPSLIRMLAEEQDPRVRRWVARSLGQIGAVAGEAVPALLLA